MASAPKASAPAYLQTCSSTVPPPHHDLDLVAQAGLRDGPDGFLHRIEGEGEEAGEGDDLGLDLDDLVDEGLDRDVDAEVVDLEAVDVEHEDDDVLADVVDVALDGADDDLAELLGGFLAEVM